MQRQMLHGHLLLVDTLRLHFHLGDCDRAGGAVLLVEELPNHLDQNNHNGGDGEVCAQQDEQGGAWSEIQIF